MSFDYRIRNDTEISDISAEVFFTETLPGLWETSSRLVTPWLQFKAPGNLSLECDGAIWSLAYHQGELQIQPGPSESGLHVRLSKDDFSGMINDLYTPMTFYTGGTLDIPRGELGDFLDWWLVLRGLLDRRPVHVPGALEFPDRNGEPLDLTRSFQPGDSVDEMRHFLETAGFLHLKAVFTEEEMAGISRDMDNSLDCYHEGDGLSWWASTADGERKLVRMQAFDTHSATTAALLDDPRFQALGDITGAGHSHKGLKGNRIEALIKPLHVVQGLSDLPWHKDCSLGRHSYDCCGLTAGISVTGAGADSGQLRVVAGSHRVLMWPALISSPKQHGLPELDLATETGDVTLHLSCTLHMAQAPTARERRVMYTGFRLPALGGEHARASLERISKVREAAYRTVSQ
jgi:hypothetical protein